MAFLVSIGTVYAQIPGLPGPYNAITDVPGIEVGQYSEGHTGTTVIIARNGAMGAVDQRGGWPGTINTDVLSVTKTPQLVDAIILTAGSYYGLSTFQGVFDYFRGLTPPPASGNPLISGAVVYDLGRGPVDIRPDATFGYKAAQAAKSGPVDQGNVGAGTSTRVGGLKGGVGTASLVLDGGVIVGALVVTNAIGRPYDPATAMLYGLMLQKDGEWRDVLRREGNLQAFIDWLNDNFIGPDPGALDEEPGKHTTIGVIATNAQLTSNWLLAMM